jgi:hypothetical protein
MTDKPRPALSAVPAPRVVVYCYPRTGVPGCRRSIFYPVFPPDTHAAGVIDGLRRHPIRGS